MLKNWDVELCFIRQGKDFSIEVREGRATRLNVRVGHTHPKAGNKLLVVNKYGNGITYYQVTSEGCITGTNYMNKDASRDEILADANNLYKELSE